MVLVGSGGKAYTFELSEKLHSKRVEIIQPTPSSALTTWGSFSTPKMYFSRFECTSPPVLAFIIKLNIFLLGEPSNSSRWTNEPLTTLKTSENKVHSKRVNRKYTENE